MKNRIKPMTQIANYVRLQHDLRKAAANREWNKRGQTDRFAKLQDEQIELEMLLAKMGIEV